jgi:hypothetical protein
VAFPKSVGTKIVYSTTLVRLERRFDLESLCHLFRAANTQGAGICSRRLIDAVIEMPEKSVHSAGETFTFNAKKILGGQY